MIPLLSGPVGQADSSSGPIYVRFPGPTQHASIAATGSIGVALTYNNPGVNTDYIEWVVNNGSLTVAWELEFPASADTQSASKTFSSSSTGWLGAGTYRFTANAYLTSNHATLAASSSTSIVLTVT